MIRIKQETKEVLAKARIVGNLLFIDEKLPPKIYADVSKVLKLIGGKWSPTKQATVFKENPEQAIMEITMGDTFVSEKEKFQFFQTPESLAQKMVKAADIQPTDKCLEPSAGKGNIAKYMPGCDCIELNPANRAYLVEHGFKVIADDFLAFSPETPYDVIVMNPPFTKGQDIKHVTHAINMARKCVVAIMSPSYRFKNDYASKAFRELLSQHNVTTEELPAGTFKESGTQVSTILITVKKELHLISNHVLSNVTIL